MVIALVAPPKFKVCNKLPPLIFIVPAPLKFPVIFTVLVVVPLYDKIPAIAAVPDTSKLVTTAPKSRVPALTLKLPPIVLLPCKVFIPLPEIVRFL